MITKQVALCHPAGVRPARHVTAAWFCSEVTAECLPSLPWQRADVTNRAWNFPGWAGPIKESEYSKCGSQRAGLGFPRSFSCLADRVGLTNALSSVGRGLRVGNPELTLFAPLTGMGAERGGGWWSGVVEGL